MTCVFHAFSTGTLSVTRKLSSGSFGFSQRGFISVSICCDSTGSLNIMRRRFIVISKNSLGALKSVMSEVGPALLAPPPGPESTRISQILVSTMIFPGTVMR